MDKIPEFIGNVIGTAIILFIVALVFLFVTWLVGLFVGTVASAIITGIVLVSAVIFVAVSGDF